MDNTRKIDREDVLCIFLGYDKRQVFAADFFGEVGISAIYLQSLQDMDALDTENRDIYLIFPIPLSPKAFIEICHTSYDAFFKSINNKKVTLVGGKINEDIVSSARSYGIRVVDFGDNEAFLTENAYLTAQATVNIIMQSLPRSIRSMNIALFGYGRISKFLLAMFKALGASVKVFARREDVRVLAKCDGAIGTYSFERDNVLYAFNTSDVIINTVPSPVIDTGVLSASQHKPILIDLASLPGGIDIDAAQDLGYKASRELGLPAKYAPSEAGEIVARTLLSSLFRFYER